MNKKEEIAYQQQLLHQVEKVNESAADKVALAKNVQDLLNMLPPDRKQSILAKAEKDPFKILRSIMDALEELGMTWKEINGKLHYKSNGEWVPVTAKKKFPVEVK